MINNQIKIINPSQVWNEAVLVPKEFGDNYPYSKTHLAPLDEHFKCLDGEHLLVYGLPHMGKTTVVTNILRNQLINDNRKTILWCPEEFSTKHVVRKFAEAIIGKKANNFTDQDEKIALEASQDGLRVVQSPRLGVGWKDLKNALKTARNEFKFNNILFDHAMMLEKSEANHEDNVRTLMNEVIIASEEFNAFSFLVNHVAKPTTYFDSKLHKRYIPPQLSSDMAHGQMWERLAYNIMEVYRPDSEIYPDVLPNETWLNLRKVKNDHSGAAKEYIKVYYDVDSRLFTERTEEHNTNYMDKF